MEVIQYCIKTNTLIDNTIKAFKQAKIKDKFKTRIRPFIKLKNARKVLKNDKLKVKDLV